MPGLTQRWEHNSSCVAMVFTKRALGVGSVYSIATTGDSFD